jgi:hypothetical protein
MTVSRRTLIKGSAALGAIAALPVAAQKPAKSLVIFDSRIPESLAFAQNAAAKIDVAALDASLWAALRGDLEGASAVSGLTGWTDWIVARGFLEERGLRLTSESRVGAPLSGKAHLFKWKMA